MNTDSIAELKERAKRLAREKELRESQPAKQFEQDGFFESTQYVNTPTGGQK